jgi:hypothetical protein
MGLCYLGGSQWQALTFFPVRAPCTAMIARIISVGRLTSYDPWRRGLEAVPRSGPSWYNAERRCARLSPIAWSAFDPPWAVAT